MVTMKICPELFLMSVFDPCISQGFLDLFLGCKRSTYTRVNTVLLSFLVECATSLMSMLKGDGMLAFDNSSVIFQVL